MLRLFPDLWLLCAIFVVVFGACVGSFLNVCIYRIPLDQSIVKPRSHCMTCGKLIPWYHNIPVFSYFICRGKCFNCKSPFSARYAMVELFTGFMFLLAFTMWPPTGGTTPIGLTMVKNPAQVMVYWIIFSGLIVSTFVDFDHYIIPDSISIGGCIFGIIASCIVPEMQGATSLLMGLKNSVIGFVCGFVPLQTIRLVATYIYRRNGRIEKDEYAMGFGDIKLMGAIGACLGATASIFTIMSAALFGTIVAIPMMMLGKKGLLDQIPFGPYIALGAVTWILWGQRLVNYYMSLLTNGMM